ncbi:MAG: ATPase, T2SS/T4P/T4SS family [bacterium]
MSNILWSMSMMYGADAVMSLDRLINFAHTSSASDIHIDVDGEMAYIKLRINGHLFYYAISDHFLYLGILGVIKSRAHMRIDVHDRGQDGSFIFYPHRHRRDKKVFVRVSINPTFHGEAVVLRILDQTNRYHLDLGDLGMNTHLQSLIGDYVLLENSLILVSGATGSGKTTTMYSLMKFLNPESCVIISLEDPVEKHIPNVRQVSIRSDFGFSYENALRVALRQDPDVIVIGEIRDKETAQIAVEAALTGHLIIAGIHGRDPVDVILRLTNLGVDDFLISQTLALSIHQKMIYGMNAQDSAKVSFSYLDFFKHGGALSHNTILDLKKKIKKGNVTA